LALLVLVAACAFLCATPALAQAESASWPPYPLDGHKFLRDSQNPSYYGRGPGGYLSIFTIIAFWFLFLCWIKFVDWVNKDCVRTGMSTAIWNSVVFFPFIVFFFVFGLSVPYIGFLATFVSLVVPALIYILMRNKHVEAHERVLTPDHLRHVFAGQARAVGVKVSAEKQMDYQKGAPVELTAMGGENDQANQANLIRSRQSPGFMVAKEMLAAAFTNEAEKVMLDYTQTGVAVKHQLDGVWHDVAPIDRESGDVMLAVIKTLANLNAGERRARQDGKFGAEMAGKKYTCLLTSQGVQTGERVVLHFTGQKPPADSLEAAGMRPKMIEQFKELATQSSGLVLVSSLPSGGLTTTMTLTLKSLDRYMRDFFTVEDAAAPEPDVENVTRITYNGAGGETPATVFASLFRKQPGVVIVPNLADANSVAMLCEQAMEDSFVIGTLRAKEAVEAPLRLLALKVPASQLAPPLKAVLNIRLVRKLCEQCRQAYPPNPELLKKLGIPAGKVQAFYQPPPVPEDPKQICTACRGIGYKGRTAIFELLIVDDKFREALIKQPQIESLKKVARASGQRGLQEEGIVLVAKGTTSLQELQRVLKQ
jgi:type II secretory ATPase GspE/PulE/Tfp pilus assembly ATPase PilB-like protein